MKKSIAFIFLFSVFLLGPKGLVAFADTTTGTEAGAFPVKGEIGADPETLDPQDPNAPEAGDLFWVKVELPTSVVFRTIDKSMTIGSPDYVIRNKSNYPVKVRLKEFTANKADALTNVADIRRINTLNLVTTKGQTTGSYALVKEGKQPGNKKKYVTAGTTLAQRLTAGGYIPASPGINEWEEGKNLSSEWKFKFDGKATGDFVKNIQLDNKFVFSFKALTSDGSPAPSSPSDAMRRALNDSIKQSEEYLNNFSSNLSEAESYFKNGDPEYSDSYGWNGLKAYNWLNDFKQTMENGKENESKLVQQFITNRKKIDKFKIAIDSLADCIDSDGSIKKDKLLEYSSKYSAIKDDYKDFITYVNNSIFEPMTPLGVSFNKDLTDFDMEEKMKAVEGFGMSQYHLNEYIFSKVKNDLHGYRTHYDSDVQKALTDAKTTPDYARAFQQKIKKLEKLRPQVSASVKEWETFKKDKNIDVAMNFRQYTQDEFSNLDHDMGMFMYKWNQLPIPPTPNLGFGGQKLLLNKYLLE